MGWVSIGALVLAVVGVTLLVVARIRRRRDDGDRAPRTLRRLGLAAIGLAIVTVVVAVAVSTVDTVRRRGLPPPKYPSLLATPDPSLNGTVAYVTERKRPPKGFEGCARVAPASGAAGRDVLCWPITDMAMATTVWRPDGRLLVTSFDAPVGENRLIPTWGKIVDVATGATEDVPAADLGDGARPSTGPARNPQGERLVRTGENGNVNVALVGPDGSRTVFSVKDANPDWGIQTGPVFSPDFAWMLMWDGNRLLLTTLDDSPTTRVLADDAAGAVWNFDVPAFSITDRDLEG